jgi:hypothetical protein
MAFHLEILETRGCSQKKVDIFSWAHYSYINQIFGDEKVRNLIQSIYVKKGEIVAEPGEGVYEGEYHLVFKPQNRSKVCSVNAGYQNPNIDLEDTLCQSYSLMNYFGIPFDKTAADVATVEQKRSRQMNMIEMYRIILSNPVFVEEFKKNLNPIWIDQVDQDYPFKLVTRYRKTPNKIIENIHRVLNIWEAYGWMNFIGEGKCIRRR